MKIYDKFLKGLDWVADLVGKDMLLWIAVGILGGLFIYQIIWAICIAARKKRNSCCCKVIRLNFFRRWTVSIIAWLFVVFAFLTLSGGTSFVDFGAEAFLLPALFLIAVYLMEAFFWIINRCRCYCSCCEVDASLKSGIVKTSENKNVVASKEKSAKKENAKKEELSKPEKQVEEKVEKTDKQKVVEVAEEQAVEEKNVAEKIETVGAPSMMKVRVGVGNGTGREVKKVVKGESVGRSSAKEQADKKIERIEELGAKIERQRQRAEKLTDTMEVQRNDNSYAVQTKAALSGVEDTVTRMDELQRRIEALRKVQKEREVHHTEKHSREETVSSSTEQTSSVEQNSKIVEVSNTIASQKEVSMSQKSTHQLRQEKETLKQKYDQLQGQLMQMSEDKANVGYYSDSGHFEKTGKSESLSKAQAKNKYDTEEVKRALQGLKGAMDELQKHIDMRDD